ncbi:hypothetical protein PSPO01_16610 [Paraphaeosphaeria sporulosa]
MPHRESDDGAQTSYSYNTVSGGLPDQPTTLDIVCDIPHRRPFGRNDINAHANCLTDTRHATIDATQYTVTDSLVHCRPHVEGVVPLSTYPTRSEASRGSMQHSQTPKQRHNQTQLKRRDNQTRPNRRHKQTQPKRRDKQTQSKRRDKQTQPKRRDKQTQPKRRHKQAEYRRNLAEKDRYEPQSHDQGKLEQQEEGSKTR